MGVSAFDVFQQSLQQKRIRTFIPDLDDILGGGVAVGEITEICGVPGVGKTQLSMHLALCAQYCGASASAESIYIDTEGSFLVPRIVSLAQSMAIARRDDVPTGTPPLTKEDLLRGITYFRVYDYQEQHDVLVSLSRHLASRPKVRLVLLDSAAFHCRHAFDEMQGRARALHNMTVVLRKLVCEFPIAVVLVNHVTTSVGLPGSDSTIVPALGEAWSHAISTRLLLGWEHQTRAVQVVKSISEGPSMAHFEVTEHGIQPSSRKRSRSPSDGCDDAVSSPMC
ncbi:hypothetical protein, variant 2 [Aphanomyces astaci]|uniref:DNA repair protein RAD51 homolog 3 n=1 Tax=Aphanomyces astaci TaxID=112090 RepID=W4HE58_APHAT|nr:hypothetical protein, variant 1 [Aphanomyces astaci]XP_009821843.1 hypothetical protein, variant 2 [Aphanomyces astaci]ETV89442.1 hypothetical protein, variant 1 [Aphanomyces astaci]ETV89443.1 hypothetical protein, variant 2 [Aphanomyces astaci]|eukprot:XP_009821842.1 hypothetical protein, variant 1 [Aphanomyces astaci]